VLFLSHLLINSTQASPKFMAPRHSGETRTPAVGDKTRWKSKSDLALGASPNGEGAILKFVVELNVRAGVASWIQGREKMLIMLPGTSL
jgi:hypothetical protein